MLDSGRLLLHAFLALPPATRHLHIHELVSKNKGVPSTAKKPAPPAFVTDFEKDNKAFVRPYLQTMVDPTALGMMQEQNPSMGESTPEVILTNTEDTLPRILDNGASPLMRWDVHSAYTHSFARGTLLEQPPMCFAH